MEYDWTLNAVHETDFVLVDSSGNEVAGLGTTWDIALRKVGGAFVTGAGTKAEIGSGWYRYTNTAGEADTLGPVAIRITGTGVAQQNLLPWYVRCRWRRESFPTWWITASTHSTGWPSG